MKTAGNPWQNHDTRQIGEFVLRDVHRYLRGGDSLTTGARLARIVEQYGELFADELTEFIAAIARTKHTGELGGFVNGEWYAEPQEITRILKIDPELNEYATPRDDVPHLGCLLCIDYAKVNWLQVAEYVISTVCARLPDQHDGTTNC